MSEPSVALRPAPVAERPTFVRPAAPPAIGHVPDGPRGTAARLLRLHERVPDASCTLPLPVPEQRRRLNLVATGTVKWFDAEKGHGFIVPDGGGTPLFVDHTAIIGADHKTLVLDTRVQYEPDQGEFGLEARNVSLASG